MSNDSALLQSLIYTAQRAGGAIMAVYATDFSVQRQGRCLAGDRCR